MEEESKWSSRLWPVVEGRSKQRLRQQAQTSAQYWTRSTRANHGTAPPNSCLLTPVPVPPSLSLSSRRSTGKAVSNIGSSSRRVRLTTLSHHRQRPQTQAQSGAAAAFSQGGPQIRTGKPQAAQSGILFSACPKIICTRLKTLTRSKAAC